jgi:catechol 2,3-dioxygenase-like lactoylglutathione lyase family enzyme
MNNILISIPVLHVSSSRIAEEFYCSRLGFKKEWEYRPSAPDSEPGYVGLVRDGVHLQISSFAGDGVAGAIAAFYVRDVDALFAEFKAQDITFELEPYDQTWGNREMYIRDSDGNCLRFVQNKG